MTTKDDSDNPEKKTRRIVRSASTRARDGAEGAPGEAGSEGAEAKPEGDAAAPKPPDPTA